MRPTQRRLTVTDHAFRLGESPFRLLGGALHYARVPRAAWRDRLAKLVDLGCNTVETYAFWNAHEPYEGQFEFGGDLDVIAFVELAGEMGLNAIVRPGPYCCAEWDMGGLPWWLLRVPGLKLRCYNRAYLDRVARYFDAILPRLAPLQSTRGGPLIAMQIENEYGYYGNDARYLAWLRDGLVSRGIDSLIFTSDGTFQKLTVATGGLPDVLKTANFGSRAAERFATLREVQPTGPLVCMEYWVGWFDTWRDAEHHTRPAEECASELDALLSHEHSNAVIYMFQGGTNPGFTAGGNLSDDFKPFVTSYDYDALLDEPGDVTHKYALCRDVVRRHAGLPASAKTFKPSPKRGYGSVQLAESVSLDDALAAIATPVESAAPLTMEALGHGRGFVHYRYELPAIYRGERLVLRGMHDWCHVRLGGQTLATWYRNDPMPEMRLDFDGERATLDVLVHNLARSNFGHCMDELKGLTGGAYVGPQRHEERALFGWVQHAIPLNDVAAVPFAKGLPGNGPAFYRGTLTVDGAPADTFLALPGFELGCVFVNGINIGRYWNVGPQMTLFVHASRLRSGANEVVIFDAVGGTGGRLESVDRPVLQKSRIP